MRPGLTSVSGLVDAVAMRDIAANGRLAHADVDHVGVGGRDGDAADGGASEVAVGDVLPEEPSVHGLPDAATGGAEVERVIVAGVARDGNNATAAIGADTAPLQRGEHVGVDAMDSFTFLVWWHSNLRALCGVHVG